MKGLLDLTIIDWISFPSAFPFKPKKSKMTLQKYKQAEAEICLQTAIFPDSERHFWYIWYKKRSWRLWATIATMYTIKKFIFKSVWSKMLPVASASGRGTILGSLTSCWSQPLQELLKCWRPWWSDENTSPDQSLSKASKKTQTSQCQQIIEVFASKHTSWSRDIKQFSSKRTGYAFLTSLVH